LPVQYPPGIPATLAGTGSNPTSASLAALPGPPKNVKEFTARLTELDRQISSSIAYDAAENLVSAYDYHLDDESGNSPSMHQTFQPLIQIAPDGKSATIRARLLNVGGTVNGLAGGTYEGRAINRDGSWRLQGLTLKQSWSSPFTQWTPVVERRR